MKKLFLLLTLTLVTSAAWSMEVSECRMCHKSHDKYRFYSPTSSGATVTESTSFNSLADFSVQTYASHKKWGITTLLDPEKTKALYHHIKLAPAQSNVLTLPESQ